MSAVQFVSREWIARDDAAGYRLCHYVLEGYHIYPYGVDTAFGCFGEPAVKFAYEFTIHACDRHITQSVVCRDMCMEVLAHLPIFI